MDKQQAKIKEYYQNILKNDANNIDALHSLGIIAYQEGNYEEAIAFITKAILLEPSSPTLQNSLGNIYTKLTDFNTAISCYQNALVLQPDYAVAYNSIGNILYTQKKFEEAQKYYEQAIKFNPHFINAHYNLANIFLLQQDTKTALEHLNIILKNDPQHANTNHLIAQIFYQQGDLTNAKNHYEEALKIDSHNATALHNLASIYLKLGNPQKALKYFLRKLPVEADTETYYNIGVIYMNQQLTSEAIQYFNEAVKLNPNHLFAHVNLGASYLKIEDYQNAILHYQEALRINPENREYSYIVNALNNPDLLPNAAPQEFVKNLFAQYAPYYEQHLFLLGYNTPEMLYKAIVGLIGPENNSLTILDLGCGTGLIGEKFRLLAKKLIGIDLAEEMVAIARQKEVYDELLVADILTAITQHQDLDLIIAADTFVYIGDLEQIFAQSKAALKPNGILAFTIEKTYKYPYQIQKSMRFAHSKQYIEELAQKYYFNIKNCQNLILRKDKNSQIEGYLYILIRVTDN